MKSYSWCAVGLANMDNISKASDPPSCTLFNNETLKCIFDYIVYSAGLFVSLYNSYCIAKMKTKQKLDSQSIQNLQQKTGDEISSSDKKSIKAPSIHDIFMEAIEKS